MPTLVDTGAARSAMTSTVWERYCAFANRPPGVTPSPGLRTISGDKLPVIGTGTIRLFDTDITVFIVRELLHPFVLGDDALRLLNVFIDLQGDCVYLAGRRYVNQGVNSPPSVNGTLFASAEDNWRSEFPDLFGDGVGGPLGCHPSVKFNLTLTDDTPINQRPYRVPLLKRQVIEEQIEGLLEAGTIRPSISPWASPVTMQPKKDGSMRLCIDFRAVNSVTRDDAYPMPRIQDILDQLRGSTIYTRLDMNSGFHQLPVAEDIVPVTAFVTHSGLYEWTRMPFGLKTAPAVFQRCMQDTLRGALGRFAMVYLDDVIVHSTSPGEHEEHVRTVLTLLQNKGFTLKATKCAFSLSEVDILGFRVSDGGVRPQEEKVSAIRNMSPPGDIKGIRRFLGMVGFYRNMIPSFATHAAVLTALTKKHARWKWTPDHEAAFDYLRFALTSDETMLNYPNLNKPYELYTDASDTAVGAVLVQRDDEGNARPIQFISHTLNDTQRRWPAIEREAYAIIHALKVLRPYLYGALFTIYTDHKPLKAMFLGIVRNTKVQRWAMLISEYGAPIEYIKGKYNLRADFLSRLPPSNVSTNMAIICESAVDLAPPGTNYYDGRLLADGINPEEFKAAQTSAFPHLVINDDEFVLYEGYICTTRQPVAGLEYPRLWVPDEFQNKLVIHYHGLLGHAGTKKMLQRLTESYKWPSMWKTVQAFYHRCAVCRVHSERVQRPEPTPMPIATCPGDLVALDLVGPFPESPYGNRYCLTILDHASGWLECHPISAKTQINVFRYISNHFIPTHGVPTTVLTDQGLEFRGRDLQDYFNRLGVTHKRCSPFHPQTNGRLERAHRTLKNILRKLTNTRAEEWEDCLAAALMAYRCTPGVNGFTPYFLHYGREPDVPLQRLLRPTPDIEADAVERYDHLATAFQQAARNTEQSRVYNYKRLMRQANATPLSVGDKVVVKVNERVSLDPRWDHLYIVTSVRGSVISITDQRSGHRRVVNREKLLPVSATEWEHVQQRVKRASRPPRRVTSLSSVPVPPARRITRPLQASAPMDRPPTNPTRMQVDSTPPVNDQVSRPLLASPPVTVQQPGAVAMDTEPIARRTRKRGRACADEVSTEEAKRQCLGAYLSVLASLSLWRHQSFCS